MASSEFQLKKPPTDAIQSIRFSQDNQHVLTASWDCTVRLYDVKANQIRVQYNHEAPVLDAAFQTPDSCWSAGADKKLKKFDLEYQKEYIIGQHDEPIKCVQYLNNQKVVATGGWDSMLKLWDPRTSELTSKHQHPDKIYTMSASENTLIVGTAGRVITIWDLRNMSQVQRESLLKYQIRCIETFPDANGYVVGSIEGRVAVEYLEQERQKQRYAFKCHRNKDTTTGLEMIYPVHSISFHKRYNTFATGGGDGYVSIWDGKNKKRLVQFHRYPTAISSLCFSPDGTMLAIACSKLDIDEESCDATSDSIFIRHINDQEVRNKG